MKKAIPGYPGYFVTDAGAIIGKYGRSLKPRRMPNGYLMVHLHGDKPKTFLVHRLVLFAFRGAPQRDFHGSHLDGDRSNNRLSNLVWESPKQNAARKLGHGTHQQGTKNHQHKLSHAQVVGIRVRRKNGVPVHSLAAEFGISRAHVWQITTFRRRAHD